jgi:hypothetical protein
MGLRGLIRRKSDDRAPDEVEVDRFSNRDICLVETCGRVFRRGALCGLRQSYISESSKGVRSDIECMHKDRIQSITDALSLLKDVQLFTE